MRGYQLVEFEEIDFLIRDDYMSFYISLLLYVSEKINKDSNYNSLIRVDIVKVEYISTYPALGIMCLDDSNVRDFEDVLISEFKRIIKEKSIIQLLGFMENRIEEILKIKEEITL